ncbi:Very short patch repair protein [subsurface metagenome]
MVDVVDKETRSRMMAGIRGRDTRPELGLRRALHRLGFRYRLHVSRLPGRPDIVLSRHRAIVEVHGCFWHRHNDCVFKTKPASNTEFWKRKFSDTIARDRRNQDALRRLGWRIAIVWECAIKAEGPNAVANKVARWIVSKRSFREFGARARLGK